MSFVNVIVSVLVAAAVFGLLLRKKGARCLP
jgi:hypothetical protein